MKTKSIHYLARLSFTSLITKDIARIECGKIVKNLSVILLSFVFYSMLYKTYFSLRITLLYYWLAYYLYLA